MTRAVAALCVAVLGASLAACPGAPIAGDAGASLDGGALADDDSGLGFDGGGALGDGGDPPSDGGDLHESDGGAAGDGGAPTDGGDTPSDGGDTPDGGATYSDGGALPDAGPLSRGAAWVRANPMFISGLAVNMGAPTTAFVAAYRDDFHATAAHLWATGMPDEVAAWAGAWEAAQTGDAGAGDDAGGANGGGGTTTGMRFVSWLDADGHSVAAPDGGLLGGAPPALPGRIGYQVGDEPGNGCDGDTACALAELARMGDGLDAVRAADPEALVWLNFNTKDFTPALLDEYATLDADVVSYDDYQRGSGSYEALALFRAAGLAQGRPYWRYLRSFYQDGDDALTASDLRWDAFSGLVYGYTGHTWFIYDISASVDLDPALFTVEDDFAAAHTPLYDVAAQINVELRHLGRAITQLTSTDVRYIAAIELLQPQGTEPWSVGAGGDPYLQAVDVAGTGIDLSIGCFVDPFGERAMMVQNVSHTNGSFPTNHENDATVTLTFDFAAAPAGLDQSTLLVLDPRTGATTDHALVQQGEARSATFVLGAGDPMLFKYATGRDFLRGP